MVLLKKSFPGKSLIKNFLIHFTKPKKWQEVEYFDESWKERIKAMSTYIGENKKVMDLGCGKMWLLEYLPAGCTYIPVDYKKRSENCIVADFNNKEYPEIKTDIAFISGCLEYVNDYTWFLSKAASFSELIIVSYCTTDYFPSTIERKKNYWVNHLSRSEITKIFSSLNWNIRHSSLFKDNSNIFVVERCKPKETI